MHNIWWWQILLHAPDVAEIKNKKIRVKKRFLFFTFSIPHDVNP